jgi:hypothetical protein
MGASLGVPALRFRGGGASKFADQCIAGLGRHFGRTKPKMINVFKDSCRLERAVQNRQCGSGQLRGLARPGSRLTPSPSPMPACSDRLAPLGKPVRLRDKDHRKFVLRQPCLVCGRVPSDPHHLTFTQPRCDGPPRKRRVHRPGLPDPPPRAPSGRRCPPAANSGDRQ